MLEEQTKTCWVASRDFGLGMWLAVMGKTGRDRSWLWSFRLEKQAARAETEAPEVNNLHRSWKFVWGPVPEEHSSRDGKQTERLWVRSSEKRSGLKTSAYEHRCFHLLGSFCVAGLAQDLNMN